MQPSQGRMGGGAVPGGGGTGGGGGGPSGGGMNTASFQNMQRLQQQLQAQYKRSQQQAQPQHQHQQTHPLHQQAQQPGGGSIDLTNSHQAFGIAGGDATASSAAGGVAGGTNQMSSIALMQLQQQQHQQHGGSGASGNAQNLKPQQLVANNSAASMQFLLQQQAQAQQQVQQQQQQQQQQQKSQQQGAAAGSATTNSALDASSQSSARIMAMAGMAATGGGNTTSVGGGMSSNDSNPSMTSAMQNMQFLLQQQQQQQQKSLMQHQQQPQQQGGGSGTANSASSTTNSANPTAAAAAATAAAAAATTTTQQQLLLQQQFANLQKQMQQGGMAGGAANAAAAAALRNAAAHMQGNVMQAAAAAAQAQQQSNIPNQQQQGNLLQARQQQLLQHLQQQQQQGGTTATGSTTTGTNTAAGILQPTQQQGMSALMGSIQPTVNLQPGMNAASAAAAAAAALAQSTSQGNLANATALQQQQQLLLQQQQQQLQLRRSSSASSSQARQAAERMLLGGQQNQHQQLQQQQLAHAGSAASFTGYSQQLQHANSSTGDMSNHSSQPQSNNDTGSVTSSHAGSTAGNNNKSTPAMASNASTSQQQQPLPQPLPQPIPQQQQQQKQKAPPFLDGNFAGGWQSNEDLPDRRRIIFHILDVIRLMRPNDNKISNKLPHMAKSLEEHLYRSAQTKDEYLDMSTLRPRLQKIAQSLELHRPTSRSSLSSQQPQPQQQQQQQQQQQGSSANQSNSSWPGPQAAAQANLQQQQPSFSSIHGSLDTSTNSSGMAAGQMGHQQLGQQQSHYQGSAGNLIGQHQQHGSGPTTANTGGSNSNNTGQQQNTPWGSAATTGAGLAEQGKAGNLQNPQQQQAIQQQQMAALSAAASNNPALLKNLQALQKRMGQQHANVSGLAASLQQAQADQQQQDQQQQSFGQQQQQQGLPTSTGVTGPASRSSSVGSDGLSLDLTADARFQDPSAVQKRRVILQQQQRLLLLRHASKCTVGPECPTKFCSQMVTLWKHMKTCRDRNCRTSHCLSSRCVLNHYRICKSNGKTASCEVCGPVMSKIKQLERDDGSADPLTREQDQQQQQPQQQQQEDPMGASAVNTTTHAMQPKQSPPPPQQQQPAPSSEQTQLQQLQSQQMKLQQRLENLQQLQKQQNTLLEQQRRLQEQAQNIKDPNSKEAQQLQQQQMLLSQLQKRCQQQQLLLQHELQEQANAAAASSSSGGGGGTMQQPSQQKQQSKGVSPQLQQLQQQQLQQQQQQVQLQQQLLQQQQQTGSANMPTGNQAQSLAQSVLQQGASISAQQQRQLQQQQTQALQAGQGMSEMQLSLQQQQTTAQAQPTVQLPKTVTEPAPKKRRSRSQGGKAMARRRGSGKGSKGLRDVAAVQGEAAKKPGARKRTVSQTDRVGKKAKAAQGLEAQQHQQRAEAPQTQATSAETPAKTPPAQSSSDTSLVVSMTKEEISQHLKSLNKKIWLSSRTVTHKCLPVIQALIDDQFGWVFHDSVDPVALGLPDYFDVVKNPMHLELVKKKLENAIYSDMESFERDVRLVFENAILYNGEQSEVGELAQSMLSKFDKLFKAVVQGIETSQQHLESKGEACSLCGTQKRKFEPTVLYCQGTKCGMQRIKRQAKYFTDRTKQNHWCEDCYTLLGPNEPIVLDDGSDVLKKELQEFKNDAVPEEGWVNCDECKSWVHQICALFNGRTNKSTATYTCPNCYLSKLGTDVPRAKVTKSANDLPESKMSRVIEKRLMDALQVAYSKRAEELGVGVEEVEKAEGLSVRVLSNVDKKHIVGDEMFQHYSAKGCPNEFPVRTKCVALFQKIHGVDSLLFALYVYEYGHDSPAPNKRRVYISYLDSVQYFEPKCYRTEAYHSILIEYLRYVKNRGFHTAHIWSCPPTPGDDYIFYCHPEHQKIPREDMLRAWYHQMLDSAKTQGVVIRTTNLYDEYFSNNRVDPVPGQRFDARCLPYFEGDYIPGEIENIIKQFRPSGNSQATGADSNGSAAHDSVMERIGHNIRKMKDNFIVVHLRNRRFAAAVERGEDVSHWREDSDDEVVRSKRAKISGKLPGEVTSSTSDGKASSEVKEISAAPQEVSSNDPKPGENVSQAPIPASSFIESSDAKEQSPAQPENQSPEKDGSDNKKEEEVVKSPSAETKPDHDKETMPEGTVSSALAEIKPAIAKHFANVERSKAYVNNTSDEDEPFESEMFESRQQFLNYCQTTHCQFDELRRAKHATMMVLFQLHNPSAPKFLQQCGACYVDITHGVRYHCTKCPDFDLCSDCYQPVTTGLWAKRDARFAHDKSHTFTPIDLEATAESKASRAERQKALQNHVALIEHAGTCSGPPACSLYNCKRIKGLFEHVPSCDIKPKKDCKVCSRLLSLCAIHARSCSVRGGTCPIPFCDRIRERHMRLRRQQQHMDDRRRQAQNELYHARDS